jgi:hypothetical protein
MLDDELMDEKKNECACVEGAARMERREDGLTLVDRGASRARSPSSASCGNFDY